MMRDGDECITKQKFVIQCKSMQICLVTGNVVSTQKVQQYYQLKLMLVQPVDLDSRFIGDPFVAIDSVDSGPGDQVLVCTEGGSANIVLGTDKAPIASVIVGVIDSIDLCERSEEGKGKS